MALSTDHVPHKAVRRLRVPEGSNLNGSRSKKYGWGRGDILTAAKLLAREFAEERAGSDARLVTNSEWACLGIQKQGVWEAVTKLLPDLESVMEQLKPGADHAQNLFSRLYNMYNAVVPIRERTPGEPSRRQEITAEHPARSVRLRPYWEGAQRLYRRGRPVTREQLTAFGFKNEG